MKDTLTIHFISDTLYPSEQTPGAGLCQGVYTVELIAKGQLLITKGQEDDFPALPEDEQTADRIRLELIPGDFTTLSDDGNSLQALISGYPHLEKSRDDKSIAIQVNMVPLLQITEDNMQAHLTLYPAVPGIPPLDPARLTTILQQEKIAYGIDQQLLQEIVDQQAHATGPLSGIPIARGILPIDGKDAYLRFEMEIGPLPGKLLRDGTIDFRERKIFTGVDANQVIACKVPQTLGSPGINVYGETIPPWPGKDITVKLSGDVSFQPDTGQVIATRAGVLTTVKGNEIKVITKQTISGDIDFTVGNIESKDSVDVKGGVCPGFHVHAAGDLLIGGNVEGATVRSYGNAVIKGGLLGEHASLETLGDADIGFVERSQLSAGGGIMLRNGAYYSTVIGDGDICCTPQSRIIGGLFCCAGNFVGGNVGSNQGGAAVIAAGVESKRLKRYLRLKQQIVELESQAAALEERDGSSGAAQRICRQIAEELLELQTSLKKINLIPETPLFSRTESAFNHCDARITMQGRAAIGTRLRIGNLTKTLKEEYTGVEFFIAGSSDRIDVKKL